jgi:hypothetical protein
MTLLKGYLFAESYSSAQALALATTTVFLSTAFSLLALPVLLYLREVGWF